MKQIFVLTASISLLSACSNINRIITIDDDFKNEKSIRLIQELRGYSDEQRGSFFWADYIVNLKTLYLKPKGLEGIITAELTLETETRPEDLDSLIFIEADGKKYQLISNEYAARHFMNRSVSTSTTTSVEKEENDKKDKNTEKVSTTTKTTTSDQTLQVMKRTIEIPRDIWDYLSQAEQVEFRFYIGNEGVTVCFSSRDRKKFANLFNSILLFEKSHCNS